MKTQRKFGLCAALLAAATLFLACTTGTQSAPPPESNALTIKFDSTVACKKGSLGNEGDVTTGAEVKEGDWYKFTALGLSADEIIENWYVNGNKKSTDKDFTYQVKKSDADSSNVINITYTKKTAAKLTLKFNPAEVICKKGYSGNKGDVTTGAEVKEGNWYKFTALGLSADEIIENWYVNGNKKSSGKDFSYQVEKSDADTGNVINITYTKKTATKLTLKFNSAEVICKKGYSGNEGDVTTGAEVKEGDWYKFSALGLTADEIIENWYVNGNKKSTDKDFTYQVKKSDADSSNVINITYTKKTAKLTVTFNTAKVDCKKGLLGDKGDVTTGAEVKEGDWYKFTALGLTADEKVENWYINGNKNSLETHATFTYNVKKSDADSSNVINVTFTKKTAAKLTLTFNPAKVACKKGYLGNEGDVTTGTEVKEGDWFRFTALGLTADEKVENWYINGNKNSLETHATFTYNVKKSDADSSNVINVTYKKKTAMKATLTFDSAGIKCEKGYLGFEGDVTAGVEVKEGEGYKFTALLNPGETVKHWIVNGNPKTYATETTFSYIVMATDISSDNKLSVSFVKN